MKRDEIKTIFPDATDEQLKAVMDLNGADVERAKSKATALEAELNESREGFSKLNAEFEALKTANADGTAWKTKFEALQAEIDEKAKQAAAEQAAREKADAIGKRFTAAVGEKKFSHGAVRDAYLKKFAEALDSPDYAGQSDLDILHALSKDDAAAFQGAQIIKLAGGKPTGAGGKVTREDFQKMSYKDRLALFNENPDLYHELTD